MSVYIGLDLSLRSPGFAMYDVTKKVWTMACFAQRKRECALHYSSDTSRIIVLPAIPDSLSHDCARYDHIVKGLQTSMLDSCTLQDISSIAIEGYAFTQPSTAGSSFKLHELGGAVKHWLFRMGLMEKIKILQPSQWKRMAMGNGRASKMDTVAFVRNHGPSIDLMDIFGLKIGTHNEIPTPVQDLADAVGIVLATLPNTSAKNAVTKKKKRKAVNDIDLCV